MEVIDEIYDSLDYFCAKVAVLPNEDVSKLVVVIVRDVVVALSESLSEIESLWLKEIEFYLETGATDKSKKLGLDILDWINDQRMAGSSEHYCKVTMFAYMMSYAFDSMRPYSSPAVDVGYNYLEEVLTHYDTYYPDKSGKIPEIVIASVDSFCHKK